MIQIQEMFKNGKPDIVLKTVKGFDIKRTPFTFFIQENSLKFGIGVLVMIYKILVIVFTINFYFKINWNFDSETSLQLTRIKT